MKENADVKPRHLEMMEGYEEMYCVEKNRDRYERRWYKVCSTPSLLTKTQEEWSFIKTVGQPGGSQTQQKGIVKAVTYR